MYVVYVRGGHCALTLSLALAFGHVHTSYGVYVMGGKCTDLVGWPRRGRLAWLKNLSISEGMFRRFNWSMVFGTAFGQVYSSYDT